MVGAFENRARDLYGTAVQHGTAQAAAPNRIKT
jgi:hypothetical protein